LAALRARTSADTSAQRDDAIEGRFATLVWELRMEAPYTIVAQRADGTSHRVEDAGRRPAPRASLFDRAAESQDGLAPSSKQSFSLKWVAPDIACIRWTRMDPREKDSWEAFVRQSAAALADRKAAGLIVDLRNNSGGTSSMAKPLLGMISDRTARMAGGKVWRKSEDYDRFLESCVVWWARGLGWRSRFSSDYASMGLGEERVIEASPPAPFSFTGPRFSGEVVVLIGPRTFSSAVMAADAIATYDLATLAGRPTGGVPNSHGEIGFTRLARSGLIVSFSSAQFIRASGDAADVSPAKPSNSSRRTKGDSHERA
jgi:Peptidase family S41